MSRYDTEEQDTGAQQAQFDRGVAYTLPGDRVPPGHCKRLVNAEVRTGMPANRRGTRKVTWMMNGGLTLGTRWQGVQEFRPSRNDFSPAARVVLAVVDDDLWLCAPGNEPRLVQADLTAYGHRCEIIPAFNVALILRNLSEVPLLFDPNNGVPAGAYYGSSGLLRSLPRAATGSVLPAAATGCYHAGRVWLKSGYDEVIASDIFEWRFTSTKVYRVESGGNGEIMKLWPYGEASIAIFKNDGVYRAVNATGDLASMVIERVYGAHGCVAADSVRQEGDSIYYLSASGVERLLVTGQSLVVQSAEAFSHNVSPLFRGLSWPAAGGARGLVVDNYYVLAVPTRATWREVDALARRWGGVAPEVSAWEPGFTEVAGPWQTFSRDYVVSAEEAYTATGWEPFSNDDE